MKNTRYNNDINIKEWLSFEWLTNELYAVNCIDFKELKSFEITHIENRSVTFMIYLNVDIITSKLINVTEKMVLKLYKPRIFNLYKPRMDSESICGEREVEYFKNIMPINKDNKNNYLYSYGYSQFDTCYLLMKNISDKWYSKPYNSQNYSMHEMNLCVTKLAEFHAKWWDDLSLAAKTRYFVEYDEFHHYINYDLHGIYEEFMNTASTSIPQEHKHIYDRVFTSSDILFNRLNQRKNLTLIHGDSHLGNYFFPRNPEENQVIMLDWSMWDIHIPMKDIANIISLSFYQYKRKKIENSLLKTYYDTLQSFGIKSYSYDDMIYDYKLSIIMNLFAPMLLYVDNDIPNVWWSYYIRSITAFEDNNCMDII